MSALAAQVGPLKQQHTHLSIQHLKEKAIYIYVGLERYQWKLYCILH